MWFHPDTAAILAKHLGIAPHQVDEAMGNDVRQVWVGNNYAMEGIVHEHDGETHTDAWGITWVREGQFNQVQHSPLAEATDEQVGAYVFPYGAIPELMQQLERLRPHAGTRFIGADVSPCLFELLCRVRGMEQAIEDLALQPEISASLFGRATEFSLALSDAAFRTLPLDWLWTGDDVAGQQCMMMNPRQWRSLHQTQPRQYRCRRRRQQCALPLLRGHARHHPRSHRDRHHGAQPHTSTAARAWMPRH